MKGRDTISLLKQTLKCWDYWLRAGWQLACSTVKNAANITGIIRYDASSTVDPATTSEITINDNCVDEPLENLVPYLAMNVGNFTEVTQETLCFVFESYFMWKINTSSLYMNWSDPTTLRGMHDLHIFPTEYNVVFVEVSLPPPIYLLQLLKYIRKRIPWINGLSTLSKTRAALGKSCIILLTCWYSSKISRLSHPIHLHGHDFWILGQQINATFSPTTSPLNLSNLP